MSDKLVRLNQELDSMMIRISDRLGPAYRLTLICRYDGDDLSDADIVKTDDDFTKAEQAMKRLASREPISDRALDTKQGGATNG